MTIRDAWKFFDMLTCEHPMLADIEDWMIPPYPEWVAKKREDECQQKAASK